MTNRVEALFMPSIRLDEVNMSERKHKVLCSIPNTTAKAVCYIHWHYSVVGVTVTLALLEHPAPCRMQNYSNEESTAHRERGAFVGQTLWPVAL